MFKEASFSTLRDGCDTGESCYRTGTPVTSGPCHIRAARRVGSLPGTTRGSYTQVSSHILCCQSVSGIGVPV